MFLQSLNINGFKSFAKKTELKFNPGITAIVGPNGSGKSNCADAVRWVLGEQSIKLLRGKKSEDVIFSGSDKKTRLGMAEVSLYFNNEDDRPKIGISEICITRRLYRSGESEYLLNNQKTRLYDIQMLLAKAGIANASYSIIGQGMIDQFLLASSQDRKEFFEEASGVKPLQIKRNHSLNKLASVEENLQTAQIQLSEITPRLNSLNRQVKKLEKRAEVELNLKKIQHNYFASLWHEINFNWKHRHDELKKVASSQDEFQQNINNLQNQMASLTKDSAKSQKFEKLQDDYQKLLEKKMKISEELSNLKIKMARVIEHKVSSSDIPYKIGLEILKALNSLKPLKQKIKDGLAAKDYSALQKYFNQQNKILEELERLTRPFRDENRLTHPFRGGEEKNITNTDILTPQAENLENQIKQLEKQISNTQELIKIGSQKEKEERSQIWQLQQKYQQEQQKLNEISGQVNALRIELARFETKHEDLENEIRQELGQDGLVEMGSGGQTRILSGLNENQKRELVTEIAKLKHQLSLIGGIDPEIKTEYEEISARHNFLFSQIDDLKKSIASLEQLILDLDENIKKQFDESFKIINEEFQKYFKILFSGGRAKLILLTTDDKQKTISNKYDGSANDRQENVAEDNQLEIIGDESEAEKITERLKSTAYYGVEIEATPPGKKLKSINMLSGGERAMTSIAMLCAILSFNPSPFVMLDEVDAALDEANSIRFAEILENLSHKSQFIVITHNRATMEKADILYGVTMGDDGVSTLLSLKLEGAEKYTNR